MIWKQLTGPGRIMNSTEISGIYISLSTEELAFIYESLDAMGYSRDGTGLREYLIDSLEETEIEDEAEDKRQDRKNKAEKMLNDVQQFIKENPRTASVVLNAVQGIFRKK